MKIIFVASGNKENGGVTPFIRVQYESLIRTGKLEMRMFESRGHGIRGYLKNARELRKVLHAENPDIVHVHYKFCLFMTVLAMIGIRCHKDGVSYRPKLFMSVMGGFPNGRNMRNVTRFFVDHFCDGALAKSQQSADELGCRRLQLHIVPNGVNLDELQIVDKAVARKTLGLDPDRYYILWPTHPHRYQKNYPLAVATMDILHQDPKYKDSELLVINNRPHEDMTNYICAVDTLLSTSRWEGSPNVVKEALALNCPIVATVAGDIPWLLDGVKGCYVIDDGTAEGLAQAVKQVLEKRERINGRPQIEKLQIGVTQVAERLITIYSNLLAQ